MRYMKSRIYSEVVMLFCLLCVTFTSCEKEHEENPYIQLTNELQTKYKKFCNWRLVVRGRVRQEEGGCFPIIARGWQHAISRCL